MCVFCSVFPTSEWRLESNWWQTTRSIADTVSSCDCRGVSRMQTSLRRRHRDRVVRHGVGMMIESDFYASAPPEAKHEPCSSTHLCSNLLVCTTQLTRGGNILPTNLRRSSTVRRHATRTNTRAFTQSIGYSHRFVCDAGVQETCNYDGEMQIVVKKW